MPQIYSVYLDKDIKDCQFDNLLALLSLEKQDKIKQYAFRMDALRSLVADLLSRYLIGIALQIKNEQIQFEVNKYGKPFVKEAPELHFNVSHSGNWVVCAIDTQPIGIDVEQMNYIDVEIAEHFFSKKEQQDLKKVSHQEQQSYFFDLWCLKESYIKMVGKGLSIPLDSFTFRCIDQQILFYSDHENSPAYFKKYELGPDYKMAVCQRNSTFTNSVYNIPLQTLSDEMLNKKNRTE
ncbi:MULTISPECIES: 4'-phosphopantetheinyl transferase family protein [Bacillus cereus group]|uniref:4'-phosphopantetheinyl transferase family protein n=1 Tax=Bacillus cereus group TaxID=86661 RepID=UPI00041F7BE4|nr:MULTISPECIES: 4'-phosphopantetheinyl transferase superfamily protein [Bacillus cereus group]QUG94795.1 4'-phosphopantetheinyl transferase superfamily protein [Bacillus tropicus]